MAGWGALARGAYGLLVRMVPAVGMPGRPEANCSLVVREYPLEKDFVFVFVFVIFGVVCDGRDGVLCQSRLSLGSAVMVTEGISICTGG
jgi:hypothetical protein